MLHDPNGMLLEAFYSGLFLWLFSQISGLRLVPPKELLFLTKYININYDLRHRSGNTLRFPRVTREPPCPGKGYADVVRKGRF